MPRQRSLERRLNGQSTSLRRQRQQAMPRLKSQRQQQRSLRQVGQRPNSQSMSQILRMQPQQAMPRQRNLEQRQNGQSTTLRRQRQQAMSRLKSQRQQQRSLELGEILCWGCKQNSPSMVLRKQHPPVPLLCFIFHLFVCPIESNLTRIGSPYGFVMRCHRFRTIESIV